MVGITLLISVPFPPPDGEVIMNKLPFIIKEYPNKITTDSIRKHIKDFEIHQKMITKDSIFVTEVEYKKRQDSTDYEQLKRYSQLYRILSVNTEALSRIEARQLNQ